MDLRATKTHSERVDDEAERLVRPAPKDKPPRRDLRRERVEIEDGTEKKDKDLSLNFKDIGGSLQERITWRFLSAKTPRIKVRLRETGKVVNVSEETLKAEPGKYEKIDESEEDHDPKAYGRGEALRALTKDDPKLDAAFKSLTNPKSDVGGLAESNPDLPAASVFKTIKLPEGVATLGDMVKALRSSKPKKPAQEATPPVPEKSPEPAAEPAQEAPKAEPETTPGAEAPASEEPKAEKPKKPTKKPDGKKPEAEKPETEPEAKPKPSETEKAGISEPKRRAVSDAERMETASLLLDTFPPEVAAEMVARNLHPDDANQLVDAYQTSKTFSLKGRGPSQFAEDASSFFELNPDKVKPPKTGKNALGETVAFDKLSPEEQAEAARQNQLRVVAMSLAAQDVLTRELSMPSFTGKARIPEELSRTLATFMLRDGGDKAGEKLSEKVFQSALETGAGLVNDDGSVQKPPSNDTVAELLSHLSPGAKKMAAGYLQAMDYHQAKSQFLGGGADGISEFSQPKDIFRGLQRAREFFGKRAKLYDEDSHRAQTTFQVRVLAKLRTLDPDNYKGVRQLIAVDQKETYDQAKAKFDQAMKDWEKRKNAWEKKQDVYRGEPFSEERPEEPRKPPLYHLAVEPKQARRDAKRMWDEEVSKAREAKTESEAEPKTKTAARIVRRFTYPGAQTMGPGSDKTGVYHGVDPVTEYPGAYPAWSQGHQRDFGPADSEAILGKARGWLKTPVLSENVEGIVRDQQFRAALDLAIRESPFDGQVNPTLYNEMLAKLAGLPKPGVGQTLLATGDSSFGPDKKGTPMKLSQELRTLAAKVASTNIVAATEMLAIAEKIEASTPAPEPKVAAVVDTRFDKLKALVIRTAASDAEAKKVLLPVLQQIKSLG